MTNRLLPVNGNEASDLIAVGDAAQSERSELQASDPAFRAVLQRVHVCGGELQPITRLRNSPASRWGEAEFGGAQLAQAARDCAAGPAATADRSGSPRPGADDPEGGRAGRSPPRGPRKLRSRGSRRAPRSTAPRLLLTGASEVVDERGQGGAAADAVDNDSRTAASTSSSALCRAATGCTTKRVRSLSPSSRRATRPASVCR